MTLASGFVKGDFVMSEYRTGMVCGWGRRGFFGMGIGALSLLGVFAGGAIGQNCTASETGKVTPFELQTLDRFGRAVAVSGNFAVIGAYHDATNGLDAGAAYIYRDTGSGWVRIRKLLPNDVGLDDRFGSSVAIDGDVAIVGCVYDADLGSRSGSAYVFRFDGTVWRYESKLTASDGSIDDRFGRDVAIQGDVAVVGAIWDDDRGLDSGSAYIFRRVGGVWQEEAKLLASDGMANDKFGWAVSISDGRVLVGSKWNDALGVDSGAAYVFRDDGGGVWTEEQKLTASDGMMDDHFGYSVSLEGPVAVISSTWQGSLGLKAGAAYVFRFDGASWAEETQLLASDGVANDRFGYSVSQSGDLVLVGSFAHGENGLDAGSAYLFRHDGAGWVQEQELLASDGTAGDHFGRAVSVDGSTALVGAYFDDAIGIEAGSAYFFDVQCAAACLADLTGDGMLNFFDVSAFLTAFSSNQTQADFTGDGVLNFFDVSAFLTAFNAGCP